MGALIVLVALVVLATMVWVVMVLLAVGGVCLRRYRGAQKTYEEGVEEQLDYEEKMEEEIHARAQEDIAAGYRPDAEDSPRSNPDVAAPDRKSDRSRDDEEGDEPDLGPDIPGAVVDDGG